MAIASNTVFEVRSTASSANNGGGYVPGSTGTDFSQQNAPQYALTSVTTAGADATLLTASAAADMVGNIVKIVSGTNFTAGWYQVISVSVGVSMTLDRVCATAAGAAGVVNVGGALSSIFDGFNASVGGNTIWVKNTGTMFRSSSDATSVSYTLLLALFVKGYNTVRGDGYLGRDVNGALITTNMPTIQYDATSFMGLSHSNYVVENLNLIGARAGSILSIAGASTLAKSCKITNTGTSVSSAGYNCGTQSSNYVQDCDISLTASGGGLGTSAVIMQGGGCRIIGSRVTAFSTTGMNLGASTQVIDCTIYKCGGPAIAVLNTANPLIMGNTIPFNSGDGIIFISGNPNLQYVLNNIITDNSGFGINFAGSGMGGMFGYNRTRDNVNGQINGVGAWYTGSNYANVIGDFGGPETDYADFSNNNYSLISSSLAVRSGFLYPASIGALQTTGASTIITVTGGSSITQVPTQRNFPDIKVW